MINIIILYHESVIQKICRKNDIFLCHFPTYYFTIYMPWSKELPTDILNFEGAYEELKVDDENFK